MGEVVRAPPSAAVVRLLDDISDTVGPDGLVIGQGWSAGHSIPDHVTGPLFGSQLTGVRSAWGWMWRQREVPASAASSLARCGPASSAAYPTGAGCSCARCWMPQSSAATCMPTRSGGARRSRQARCVTCLTASAAACKPSRRRSARRRRQRLCCPSRRHSLPCRTLHAGLASCAWNSG